MTTHAFTGLYFTYSRSTGEVTGFDKARITVAAEDSVQGFTLMQVPGDTWFNTDAMEVSVQTRTPPDPLGHLDWRMVYGSDGNQFSFDAYRIEHISWGNGLNAIVLVMEFRSGSVGEVGMWRLSGDLLPSVKDVAGLAAFGDLINVPVTTADLDFGKTLLFTDFRTHSMIGEDDVFSPIGYDHIHAARSFHGGMGNDAIDGGFGNDTFFGDDGNDLISGSYGSNKLFGGSGDDSLNGGGGQRWAGDVIFGADHLFGGRGNDSLRGGGDSDTLVGGFGNDYLGGDDPGSNTEFFGVSGGDVLYGGGGRDTLHGSGADQLSGDRDQLFGGAGRDVLQGGTDSDTLTGGGGADVFSFIDGTGDFGTNTGFDEITDFSVAFDRLQIGLPRAQIHASHYAKGLVLDWVGGSVLLDGVTLADFAAIHIL